MSAESVESVKNARSEVNAPIAEILVAEAEAAGVALIALVTVQLSRTRRATTALKR